MQQVEDADTPTFSSVSQIIELLEPLAPAAREHVLRTIATWFNIPMTFKSQYAEPTLRPDPWKSSEPSQLTIIDDDKFSGRSVLAPKDFIFEKDPNTEVERLACLGYYLTHFRDTPHFKNIDLVQLNTEAAQRRLSNPAVAASNAMRDGFFVQAPRSGYKQLSAMGERFVLALPNREAAQQVKQRMASRRGRRSSGSQSDAKET